MSATNQLAMGKMNLLDFSDEILVEIFRSFVDIDLLNVAKVCTRFERIAKETVAKKYSGDSEDKHYEVDFYIGESKVQHIYEEFLQTFTNQITSVNIFMEQRTNKQNLLKLIVQHCRYAKNVIVRCNDSQFPVTTLMQLLPNLTNLRLYYLHFADFYFADHRFPKLERLSLKRVKNVNVEILKRFLYINFQLKHLRIVDCRKFPLKILQPLRDHLNGLKSIEYRTRENELIHKVRDIKVNNLESLKVTTNESSTAEILGAIGRGSKMVKSLEVIMRGDEISVDRTHSEFEDVIGLFDELTSLKLIKFSVGMNVIGVFARKLPNLTTLHLSNVQLEEISAENVLYVFKRCKHLKEFKLEGDTQVMNEEDQFNLEFQRKIANFARDRATKIRLEIVQLGKQQILITEGKIVRKGELQYWTGYDASLSQSRVHLFDLDDTVLEKIYDYLDDQAQRALYETCTRTKKAMEERIKSQWFTVSDEKTTKDVLGRFGEHITKLFIDMKTNNPKQMADTWRLVREQCSDRLTELSLNDVRVHASDSELTVFPNLTALKVKSLVSKATHIFPLMECPKLTQLQFNPGSITFPNQTTQFGISTTNLTKIRASYFDDNTHKVLSRLDQSICSQVEDFTVVQVNGKTVNVVNSAMRFRNLVTLNLLGFSTEKTNIEYLFQSCSKLKKLTLQTEEFYDYEIWQRLVRSIKRNCKDLQVIQLAQSNSEYVRSFLKEIAVSLPKVQLKTVVCSAGGFKVETFKKPTELDRIKPF